MWAGVADRQQGARAQPGGPGRVASAAAQPFNRSDLTVRELVLAGLAIACAVLAYLVIAQLHGALGASRNDDWVYYRSVSQFARDGYFDPDPFTDAMLVGQTLLAQPILALAGPRLAAFQACYCLISGLGLLTVYSFLRRFLSVRTAAFSVGCLALGPIFGSISTTFMTDVPSFALQALCLLLGAWSVRNDRPYLLGLAASLLVGLLAFTFREYAAAAALAVSMVALLKVRRAPWASRLGVVGLCATWLALATLIYIWRRDLNAADGRTFTADVIPDAFDAVMVARFTFTAAFLFSPALVFVRPRTIAAAWSRHKVLATAALAGLAWAWLHLWVREGVLLGNYIRYVAPYWETLPGKGPQLIPAPLWTLVQILSGVAAGAFAILAVYAVGLALKALPCDRFVRGGQRSAATLALLYSGVVIGILTVSNVLGLAPLFDRYLFPIVPFGLGWLIYAFGRRRGSPRQRAAGLVVLGVLAVFGLTLVDASATFDGAKWEAAKAVEKKGFSASAIDGGYEWFGLYQLGEIRLPVTVEHEGNAWNDLFANPNICVVVSFADAEDKLAGKGGGTPVLSHTARSLLGAAYALKAYRVQDHCRPAPPDAADRWR